MIWEKIKIITEEGHETEGIAPVIISASRSTDIPAFFGSSFMEKLRNGYTTWTNPFNNKTSYISFSKTRLIVFWSKNPEPLIFYLNEIERMGINFYFQFTLNDYENEKLEPNVPPLSLRIETFKKLSEIVGKEKIIWRFDPLLMTNNLSIPMLLGRIQNIGDQIINYTDRLVFSFIDVVKYKKVISNLIKHSGLFNKDNISKAEFTFAQKLEFATGLQTMLKKWMDYNNRFKVYTCAEEISLEEYGIYHNKCIDDNFIHNLFNKDKVLMDFLGFENSSGKIINLKDKGQRKLCRCIVSKDIGAYNTCKHNCLYCYANDYSSSVCL